MTISQAKSAMALSALAFTWRAYLAHNDSEYLYYISHFFLIHFHLTCFMILTPNIRTVEWDYFEIRTKKVTILS